MPVPVSVLDMVAVVDISSVRPTLEMSVMVKESGEGAAPATCT